MTSTTRREQAGGIGRDAGNAARDIEMFLYGSVANDGRVWREARALVRDGFDVRIISLADPGRAGRWKRDRIEVVEVGVGRWSVHPGRRPRALVAGSGRRATARIGRALWMLGYLTTFLRWSIRATRASRHPRVRHGHDLWGLAAAGLARAVRGRSRLVYDSHELFLEAGAIAHLPGFAKSMLRSVERALARRADAVITVNGSIASRLRLGYDIEPIVVMNTPEIGSLPSGHRLRNTLGLHERPIVVYHGALSPGRGIEQLVEAIPLLPAAIAVVFIGDGVLYQWLRASADTAELSGRLHVLPAVPIEEILDWIWDADVGVVAFQAVDINNTLGTPNKLFDYLTCGIPVVVSDFPEMRQIVTRAAAGVTCDPASPASIMAGIMTLLSPDAPAREQRRHRIQATAKAEYSWALESERLLTLYRGLAAR